MTDFSKCTGVIAYLTQDCKVAEEFYFNSPKEAWQFLNLCSSIGVDCAPLHAWNSPEAAFDKLQRKIKKLSK